jgi:hypothetical protein
MTIELLTCFKAYDIRSKIGVNIDEDVACRVGRTVAQHFRVRSVLVCCDASQTSSMFTPVVDEMDSVSLAFMDCRFNLRMSNAELLFCLNIEGKGAANFIGVRFKEISLMQKPEKTALKVLP